MTYATVSNRATTEWIDKMQATAKGKFIPMVVSAGVSRIQFIRTGDLRFSVVTEYSDEATANAAQSKIADIRSKASEEMPMSMSNAVAGGVFATN